MVSDQEIVQMVGTEDKIMTMFSASLGMGWRHKLGNLDTGTCAVYIVQMVSTEDKLMTSAE